MLAASTLRCCRSWVRFGNHYCRCPGCKYAHACKYKHRDIRAIGLRIVSVSGFTRRRGRHRARVTHIAKSAETLLLNVAAQRLAGHDWAVGTVRRRGVLEDSAVLQHTLDDARRIATISNAGVESVQQRAAEGGGDGQEQEKKQEERREGRRAERVQGRAM
jgi:hypothetical protein